MRGSEAHTPRTRGPLAVLLLSCALLAPGCFGGPCSCGAGEPDPPPSPCGDGLIYPGESCDGANLAFLDCTDLGFFAGTLACDAACNYDISACHNCGNGWVDAGEPCDGAIPPGTDCQARGFEAGTLGCTPDCLIDDAPCTRCGDALVEGNEDCEGGVGPADTCRTVGYDDGALGCLPDCRFDESGCVPFNLTALETDGIDDLADCGSPPVLDTITAGWTIEVWFRWDGFEGPIVAKMDTPWGLGRSFEVSVGALPLMGGPVVWFMHSSEPGSASGRGYDLILPGWHFLAQSPCTAVLDGVEILDGPCFPDYLLPSATSLTVGFASDTTIIAGPNFFAGAVDEVRIWSYSRTAAEMIAGMDVEPTGSEPGLVAHLGFDEGAGQTATDGGPTAFTCTLGVTAGVDPADPTWTVDVPY